MTHFVQYIWDYSNAINYNTAYSEAAHKYLLTTFYGRTNKKKYESQILEYNIRHTNIIAMQGTTLIAKLPIGSAKEKELVVNIPDPEVTWVCSTTNVLLKYNQYLDLTDNEAIVDLRLQSVKKFWRRAAQVADELSHLPDFLFALAVFVNKTRSDYDQKIQLDKRLRFKRDKDHK